MTRTSDAGRKFPGFQRPNYTMVPDELFDELMVELSGAELKVLLYIVRRTFGFKKDSDNISLSQMLHGIETKDGQTLDRGTGLSKKTLLEALRSLEERNIILTQRRQSQERGNEPTSYRLNVLNSPPGVKSTPPLEEKIHQGGLGAVFTPPLGEKLPQGVGGETAPSPWGRNSPTQKTVGQKTEEQETDRSNIRSTPTQHKQRERRGAKESMTPGPTHGATPTDPTRPQVGARARTAADLAADRLALAGFIEDFRQELNDQAPAGATLTRAINLYRRSGLTLEEFQSLLYDARRITQQHTAAIRTPLPEPGSAGRLRGKPKMAYFFGVLENALGLEEEAGSGKAEGAMSVSEEVTPGPIVAATGSESDFVQAVANAAMSRNVGWRLARELAREDPHLLAEWLDHGGSWTLARDPGLALAALIRAGERPPRTRISGD
ncbi:MAG: replication protein [Chloroflexota bacterium]|nr:replication protein [Chloroflexota bacterium]